MAVLIVFSVIISVILHSTYKKKELSENKMYTKGKIMSYFNVDGNKIFVYNFINNHHHNNYHL